MEAGAIFESDVQDERAALVSKGLTVESGTPEEDVWRGNFYTFLSRILWAPMSADTLVFARGFEGQQDDTEIGRALSQFGALAARTPQTVAEEEFSDLFYGVGDGGELLPYTSHYLTGFLYEHPLADLRGDLAELGITPSEELKLPEDHICVLCEIMHGLITGAFGEPANLATQWKFFQTHMAPWAGQVFQELEGAKSAVLYMPVGTVGRLFMAVEAGAFEMAA